MPGDVREGMRGGDVRGGCVWGTCAGDVRGGRAPRISPGAGAWGGGGACSPPFAPCCGAALMIAAFGYCCYCCCCCCCGYCDYCADSCLRRRYCDGCRARCEATPFAIVAVIASIASGASIAVARRRGSSRPPDAAHCDTAIAAYAGYCETAITTNAVHGAITAKRYCGLATPRRPWPLYCCYCGYCCYCRHCGCADSAAIAAIAAALTGNEPQ